MNNKINALNQKLGGCLEVQAETEVELQTAWNEVFKDLTVIKDAVSLLEQSKEYVWDKHGEIVTWVRFDLKPFANNRSYFASYMREEYYVEVDYDSDTLTQSVGTYIIVNDEGVYDSDSQKTILKPGDYRDEDGKTDIVARNALIEKYMESSGCYPGVFKSDYYSNLTLIDTRPLTLKIGK